MLGYEYNLWRRWRWSWRWGQHVKYTFKLRQIIGWRQEIGRWKKLHVCVTIVHFVYHCLVTISNLFAQSFDLSFFFLFVCYYTVPITIFGFLYAKANILGVLSFFVYFKLKNDYLIMDSTSLRQYSCYPSNLKWPLLHCNAHFSTRGVCSCAKFPASKRYTVLFD